MLVRSNSYKAQDWGTEAFYIFRKMLYIFRNYGLLEGVLCREWGIFNGIFVGAEVVLEEGFLIKKGRL